MIVVKVNTEQCKLIAEKIRPLQFRKDHFERSFLTFPSDDETKLRALLYITAICHQTHTFINKKKNLKGWSYLEDVFENLGRNNSELLNTEFLTKVATSDLVEKMKPFFAEDGNPENCTLDRLEERADFMIQNARVLAEKYEGKVGKLLEKTNGYLLNNGNGLYELLTDFEAYIDPLRKKSTVFIQLIVNAKLFKIKDPESIDPVMDYHMQRVLLRTGCVEVVDEQLKRALQNKEQLLSDEDVRVACIESIRIMSKIANKDYFEMDEILWSLGRSCCNEKILCQDRVCGKNPCTFYTFMDIDKHDQCLFAGICKGEKSEDYKKFWQPMVETNYY